MNSDELVKNNIGLVHACANKFRNRGIEYEELYSAGCIGLVKASKNFDSSLGYSFSTYAVPVVLGEIKRLFRDGGLVKVSRALKEKARAVQSEKEKMQRETGEEPTVFMIAEKMKLSVPETAELLLVSMPALSLTCDDEDERQIDIPVLGVEEKISEQIDLKKCLSELSENDRKIISLRFFECKTQSDVAKILGMTQVQVSRKEKSILKEIRRRMAG